MNEKKNGAVYIITGPSGAGKSSVISELIKKRNNLFFSISATTRSPRAGEQNGKDYYFVSAEEFEHMNQQNLLLEHASYVGNSYGTPAEPVYKAINSGMDVLIEVEVQGALQIKQILSEAHLIFIVPESFEILEQRLKNRGTESEEKVQGRLAQAKEEYKAARGFDYIIVNNDIPAAVNEIIEIMKIDAYKTCNRLSYIQI